MAKSSLRKFRHELTERLALSDLCARELVYKSETGYLIYERLFGEWLRTLPSA